MVNFPRFAGRELQSHEVVTAVVIGVCAVWTLKTVIRQLVRTIYPQALPGEKNTALLASPRPHSSTPSVAKDLENVVEYDYIIVGTGTAGCVLANRLTADGKSTVLAIEAGHSDLNQLMSRIPAGIAKLFRTEADWSFTTEPQSECHDRRLEWPRGKMIGGCSSINAMIYTRGAPDDYDELEQLGNKGWSYRDMLPYLKKCEKFTPPPTNDQERSLTSADVAQHGRTGPWNIGYTAVAKINQIFPYGCEAVGIPKTQDVNTDRGIIGATNAQTFIDQKGQRSSTAVAYLTADVVKRPNLKIASGQNVTRIIFDTTTAQPRAIGVEMVASKLTPIRYLVKAKKEVLLCAGSIGSPQLLKISGVGPSGELKEHNIPLVKELPGVGENLADHMAFHGLVFKTQQDMSIHYMQDPVKSLPAIIEWFRHGTGVMSSNGCNSFAWLRTADMPDAPEALKQNDKSTGPTGADLELISFGLCFTDQGKFIAPLENGYGAISSVCLRPESRGNVTLTSSSIFDAPKIDPHGLSTDYDLDMLLYGTKLAIKVIKSEPYKPYFKGWYIGPKHPIDWDKATDQQIKDHIRKSCETLYHPMGTAKMGSAQDKTAVVDDRLKVHGISGLRVIDASIFPNPIACHPCAPVVAVAEKAADLILEDSS